jgi:predicted DNA-binding transcriptional regulator AlpA
MTTVQSNRPRRLQPLKAACARLGVSPRTYYRDRSLLPTPIKLGNKLMFAEHEIDALIESLLAARRNESAE